MSQTDSTTDLKVTVKRRLERDGRWKDVEPTRDSMMRECRSKGMSKEDAQAWTYAELDRLYPPPATAVGNVSDTIGESDQELADSTRPREGTDSGRVQGLGDLPPSWPELPANASLVAEIGWVQANRLYVVEELDRGGTRVRLDRAHEPAPSRAAIGWLETSIRSYAKYVEVAAKATGAGQDEQAQERQERMDLDDVRSLLAEMQ